MNERDISKLPKWARDEIQTLRRDLAQAQREVADKHEPMGCMDEGVGFYQPTSPPDKGFGKLADCTWIVFNEKGLRVSLNLRGDDKWGWRINVGFDVVDGRRQASIVPVAGNSLDIVSVPRFVNEPRGARP